MIFAPVWSPILTFCLYAGQVARGNATISVAQVFTAYSVLVLLNGPLTTLILALPMMAGGIASFQRIQNQLNGKKRVDNRKALHNEKSSDVQPEKSDTSLTLPGISQDLEPKEKQYSLAEVNRSSSSTTVETDIIASVSGKFSWAEQSEPIINISQWNIQRKMLTLVLGPVGCGKSTLLKALLGELSSFDGIIRTNYSGVAYCDQSPWIPNETVRNIIIGGAEFDESWYRTVIKACALEQDVRTWAKGDETVAGAKGISLSGGQKQRLVCSLPPIRSEK